MMMPSIFGENLFDNWMDFPFEDEFFGKKNPLYGKHEKNLMKTDVRETKDGYEVDVDLPGFKKDNISAQLQERYSGSMSRSFYVGEGVTQDDVHAKFEDGILRLSLPKKDVKSLPKENFIAIEG